MLHDHKYIGFLKNAGEIALVGPASLDYWRQKLSPLGLEPCDVEGHAEVSIYGIQSRWMGIPFRELTISVSVVDPTADMRPAVYLVQAYNSSRVLSFLERSLFQTPYLRADVILETTPASALHIRSRGCDVLRLEMAHRIQNVRKETVTWEGAIYLPQRNDLLQAVFFANLSGEMEIRPFNSAVDTCELNGTSQQMWPLLESNFTPTEWRTRAAANHARSKTHYQQVA